MSDRMSVVLAVDAQDGRDFLRRNPEVDCAITHLSELRGLSLGSVLQTAAFAEAVSGDTSLQELWTAAHARVTPRYATGGAVMLCGGGGGGGKGAWSDAEALRARILVLENECVTADATIGSLHRELEEARRRLADQGTQLECLRSEFDAVTRERDVFERQAGEREAEIVRLAERQQQVRRDEERANVRAAREIEKNTQARKYIESVEALTAEQGRQLAEVTRQRDGLLRDIKPLRRELAETRRELAGTQHELRCRNWILPEITIQKPTSYNVHVGDASKTLDRLRRLNDMQARTFTRRVAPASDPVERAHAAVTRAIADLRNLGVYDTPNTKETPVTDTNPDQATEFQKAIETTLTTLYSAFQVKHDPAATSALAKSMADEAAQLAKVADVFAPFFGGTTPKEKVKDSVSDGEVTFDKPTSTEVPVGTVSAERVAIDKAWAEAERAADNGLYSDAATLLTAASQAEAAYQTRQKPTVHINRGVSTGEFGRYIGRNAA